MSEPTHTEARSGQTADGTGERFVERVRRERADLLLDVTARLLARDGPAALRVEDVAEEAGVAKGTVYRHFDSKARLVEAALERCTEDVLDILDAHTADAEDAEGRLDGLLRGLATLAVERPHLAALLRRELPLGFEGEHSAYGGVERRVVEILVEARKEGALSPEVDPQLAAEALLALSVLPTLVRVGLDEGPDPIARALRRALEDLWI